MQAYGIEAHNYILDEKGTWLIECYLNVVQWSVDADCFGLVLCQLQNAQDGASLLLSLPVQESGHLHSFKFNIDGYGVTTLLVIIIVRLWFDRMET